MDTKSNIYTALTKAQQAFPKIDLDGEVKFSGTKFKYATLGNILEKVRPTLLENGLTAFHTVEEGLIKTILFHAESGTSLESSSPLSMDGKIKDFGGRITYLRRYHLVSLLGIIAEEDGDHKDLSNNGKSKANVQQMERALSAIRQGQPNVLEEMFSKLELTADQARQLVNEENNATFKES